MPTTHAFIMPLGEQEPIGVFIAGLNPKRPLDKDYAFFMEMVRTQFNVAINNGRAYEVERQKALALAEVSCVEGFVAVVKMLNERFEMGRSIKLKRTYYIYILRIYHRQSHIIHSTACSSQMFLMVNTISSSRAHHIPPLIIPHFHQNSAPP